MSYLTEIFEIITSVPLQDTFLILWVALIFYVVVKRLDLDLYSMYASVVLVLFLFSIRVLTRISFTDFLIAHASEYFAFLWIGLVVSIFVFFYRLGKNNALSDGVIAGIVAALLSFLLHSQLQNF